MDCRYTASLLQAFFRLSLLFLLAAAAPAAMAAAPTANQTLDKPSGPVILTISGLINNTNADGRAEFDYKMLVELGLIEKKINTTWTPDDSVFEGVLTARLLAAVGARGTSVRAEALDDYVVHIPIDDLTRYPTLLAMHRNGSRMSTRDHGPLWIIYDNHDRPGNAIAELNARMVWQLSSLVVE